MLSRIGKKKKKEIASEYGLSPSCWFEDGICS
jgi:hypothetical protein